MACLLFKISSCENTGKILLLNLLPIKIFVRKIIKIKIYVEYYMESRR